MAPPVSSSAAFQKLRQQSVSRDLHSDELDRPEASEGKRAAILSLVRRVSVSLKSGKSGSRRNTHSFANATSRASEDRPTTSTWHKLRQATSFRHSSVFPAVDDESATVSDIAAAPIPGNGNAPPVIPRGFGGEAARANAAAQNIYFERTRTLVVEDSRGDHESAVELAYPASIQYQAPDNSISRVDFITQLPIELALQILSQLDHFALAQAALVCRKWLQVSSTNDVWRGAFYREKSWTYAMGGPVRPGMGLGMPSVQPEKSWKEVYRVKQELEANWRDGKAKPVYLNGHLDSIYCVQFDEHKIITGSRDKTIRVWDMHTYECVLIIGPPTLAGRDSKTVTEDGKAIHYATLPDSSAAAISTPKTVSYPMHHNASILCLQYDDEILVTGSSDSTCIMYDLKNSYRPIRQLRRHSAAVLDLAFDKNYIVTCSKDVTICVWDRKTGAMLKQLRGHSGPVNAVQMRGNTIVSCSGDFRVKLWNIDTGKNIREFSGHTKGLACSQFSEDSRYIASAGNDKIIRIWDANSGECLQKIGGHENLVRSLHIDSVSGRLISGSYDQDIKVFDMETGRLVLDFPKWHSSWVLGAKSDYRRIISTGQDPKILIMDFGMDIKGIGLLESGPTPGL